MCPCTDYRVCGSCTEQIMRGLAYARDAADSGKDKLAGNMMEELRRQRGYKVELVLAGVNIGTLDLRQYGKGADRG